MCYSAWFGGFQVAPPVSRIDDDLTAGTTEQHVPAVEHIPTQDSLLSRKVCLELARILLAIQPDPDQKTKRHRHAPRDPADHAGHTEGWIEVKWMAVRPRQCRCIGPCVGDDAIEKRTWDPRAARNSALKTGSAALG